MASQLLQERLERKVVRETRRSSQAEVFQKIGLQDLAKTPSPKRFQVPTKPKLPAFALPRIKISFSLAPVFEYVRERWLVWMSVVGSILFVTTFLLILYQSDFVRKEAQDQILIAQNVAEGQGYLIGELRVKNQRQKREIDTVHEELLKSQQKVIFLDRIRKDSQRMLVQIKAFYEQKISGMNKMTLLYEEKNRNLENQIISLKALVEQQKLEEREFVPEVPRVRALKSAKIVTLDLENKFAVISMGEKEGIVQGKIIQVSRGDRILGVGRVEKVYPHYAAVIFPEPQMLSEIKNGDEAQVMPEGFSA